MSESLEPGVGKLLATARQVKGLSTSDVADKLKLTARQIEALEAEEFDKLPAAVFVRGFIRNYARLLGLDAAQLIANLGEMQGATQNITVPSEGVTISASPLKRWMLYLAGALGLFLLLVALLYQWLSQGEHTLIGSTPEAVEVPGADPQPMAGSDTGLLPGSISAPTTPPAMIGPGAMPSEPPATASAPSAPAQSVPAPVPLPVVPPRPEPVTPPVPAVTNPYLAPVLPTVPAPRPEAVAPVAGASMLRFSASDDSWIQVVDSAGKSTSRLIGRGADVAFSGKPPFRVVIGNAAAVRMLYNEQNIDLRPFTGDKVARLTLE
jgi:cytoskeleton protein RodZ